ncbi:MAG: enolase C-terminal domain-like protein [Patescibacteria group bacterium]
MTITSVAGRKYTIPLTQPFSYFTASLTHLPYLLVSIETSEGMRGYGEAALAWDVNGETQEGALACLSLVRPLLANHALLSVDDVQKIMDAVNLSLYGNTGLKCGIESALFDCLGQSFKTPIHKLVGGSSLASIILQKTFSFDELTSDISATMKEAYSSGVRIFKFKVGRDAATEKTALLTARALYSDSILVLDANQAWNNPSDACIFLDSLTDARIAWVEQPVLAHDYEGLAFVRSHCNVKVMADESCHNSTDLKTLHTLQAIDYANLKLAKCGGLLELKKMIAFCEGAHIGYVLGDMIHSSLGTAYNLHAATLGAFAAYDLTLPSRIQGDCATELAFNGWHVAIPQSAGLGVTLTAQPCPSLAQTSLDA